MDAEIAEAIEEFSDLVDEVLTGRLAQATEEHNRTRWTKNADKTHLNVADNGALIDRDEKDALMAITSGINFVRKRR